MDRNKELLKLLIDSARKDYADILTKADFSPGNMEETALQIAIAKVILRNIEEFQPDFPDEIMALLFYERPLTKIYENLALENLADSLAETISASVVVIKQEVTALLKQESEECDDLEH